MAQTATVQIQMPEMGESVTEGIVLEWHVAEGDFVNEGDTVVEVSTDKVDAEVPAPTSGVITKLIASVDDEVPVGAPLAEMEAGDGSAGGTGEPRGEWRRVQRRQWRRCQGDAGGAAGCGGDWGGSCFGEWEWPRLEGHQGGRAFCRRGWRERRRAGRCRGGEAVAG